MKSKIAIIIRTYNEQKYLPLLLEKLKGQGKYISQVIVVDSGSTDSTLKIAKRYNCHIIRIPHSDFSYSYALNVGIEAAKADNIAVFSAHSIPVYDHFLKKSLPYLKIKKVAGVYGACLPSEQASLIEKIYFSPGYFALYRQPQVIEKPHMGIMANTNSLFPRRLWQKHRFDLEMTEGGEDAQWAIHWLNKGYKFIKEPKLSVYHSHGLGLKGFLKQRKHWQKVYKQALNKHEK